MENNTFRKPADSEHEYILNEEKEYLIINLVIWGVLLLFAAGLFAFCLFGNKKTDVTDEKILQDDYETFRAYGTEGRIFIVNGELKNNGINTGVTDAKGSLRSVLYVAAACILLIGATGIYYCVKKYVMLRGKKYLVTEGTVDSLHRYYKGKKTASVVYCGGCEEVTLKTDQHYEVEVGDEVLLVYVQMLLRPYSLYKKSNL